MPFNSLAYVILVIFAVVAARYVRGPAWVLIVCSVIFYSVAGMSDLAIFLATVSVNWFIQIGIASPRLRLVIAAVANIGLIILFKYKSLLLNGAPETAGSYVDTALPLGISFYCFQALAYHIDVARGQIQPAKDFKSFFLFKAFFPQLVAGPIVRAHQLLGQVQRLFASPLRRPRLIVIGLGLCALGLLKKVILADSIAPYADMSFTELPTSTLVAWVGAVLFSFQIYFDFSGYSDIAIGSAYLLGIRLPVNFRTPYLSCGPREFWQRWHISLSSWIRDYLYVPLGGSHGNPVRVGLVLVATMSIAGLWHGANFTFIAWGAAWGLYILLGRAFAGSQFTSRWQWLPHMAVVVMLWVLFRSPSLDYAISYWKVMAGVSLNASGGSVTDPSLPRDDLMFGILSLVGIAALFAAHRLEARLEGWKMLMTMRKWNCPITRGLLVGVIVLLVLIPSTYGNPFIYFRF